MLIIIFLINVSNLNMISKSKKKKVLQNFNSKLVKVLFLLMNYKECKKVKTNNMKE